MCEYRISGILFWDGPDFSMHKLYFKWLKHKAVFFPVQNVSIIWKIEAKCSWGIWPCVKQKCSLRPAMGRAETSRHICWLIRKMCSCAGLLENICWENGGPLPVAGYHWTWEFAQRDSSSKNENSFIYPYVFPNLYGFFFLLNTQYFLKNVSFGSHWLTLHGQNLNGSQREPKLFGY